LTFIVHGPIAALFRADGVAARQNRSAILPRRALSARKTPRNRPRSDKCRQSLVPRVPGVIPRVRVEIMWFRRWRFRPQVRLLDRDHRIGIRILADGSGFYALQASGYGEQPLFGVFCQIGESRQQGDEAACAGLLSPRLSARVQRAGQDLDLGGLLEVSDRDDGTAPTHSPVEKTLGFLLYLRDKTSFSGALPIAGGTREEAQPASSRITAERRTPACRLHNSRMDSFDFIAAVSWLHFLRAGTGLPRRIG